jgi:hypothetical protein
MKLSELLYKLKEQGNLRIYCPVHKMHYYIREWSYVDNNLTNILIELSNDPKNESKFDYFTSYMFPLIIKMDTDMNVIFKHNEQFFLPL